MQRKSLRTWRGWPPNLGEDTLRNGGEVRKLGRAPWPVRGWLELSLMIIVAYMATSELHLDVSSLFRMVRIF